MGSAPRNRAAWGLLLAMLAQPGWAVAHAVLHEHAARHHEAEPGDVHAHHPVHTVDTVHRGGGAVPLEAGSARLDTTGHAHEHGHPDAAYLRPGRGSDPSMHTAAPSAAPGLVAAHPRYGNVVPSSPSSRAGPDPSDPSDPRAPPRD